MYPYLCVCDNFWPIISWKHIGLVSLVNILIWMCFQTQIIYSKSHHSHVISSNDTIVPSRAYRRIFDPSIWNQFNLPKFLENFLAFTRCLLLMLLLIRLHMIAGNLYSQAYRIIRSFIHFRKNILLRVTIDWMSFLNFRFQKLNFFICFFFGAKLTVWILYAFCAWPSKWVYFYLHSLSSELRFGMDSILILA